MRKKKGLTLVELLVVIVILAALAAIALPRITTSSTTAKTRACQTNVDSMNTQIEMYYANNNNTWPAGITTVTADVNYFPDGVPTCPAGGTYSMSSSTHRVSCSAAGH